MIVIKCHCHEQVIIILFNNNVDSYSMLYYTQLLTLHRNNYLHHKTQETSITRDTCHGDCTHSTETRNKIGLKLYWEDNQNPLSYKEEPIYPYSHTPISHN